ncbi:MAG: NAD(+) synthase [Bacillota bacterium]|jgi:NAD+ synthase
MRFVVSACLLGCCCKYNGESNRNETVMAFLKGKDYIVVCPEVEGGLAVPREPSEIIGGSGLQVLQGCASVLTRSGKDVSAIFRRGGRIAVDKALEFGARAAILKERSPSCGIRSVYDGSFQGSVVPGRGVAAAALASAGLLLFSEEALPEEGLMVDYQEVTAKIVAWLKEKVSAAGAKGCVLGLSGGIDSAVVAALAQKAYPQDTLAVILPVESSPEDVEDAWLVARHLGLRAVEINLESVYHSFLAAFNTREPAGADLAAANIKPRLRMAALYYLAAKSNCLVVGTGNKSEIITGFFTKYGDAGVDLEPIGALVKHQVWELARFLQLPEKIIEKRPSAGLMPGLTDEDELGFSYRQLDEYILSGTTDADAVEKIERAVLRSRHKQEMPPVCPL